MIEFPSGAEEHRDFLRREREASGGAPLEGAREWIVVGFRLEAAGYAAGALDAYDAALREAPASASAHLGRSRALLDLDRAAASLAAAEEAERAHRDATASGGEGLLDDPDEDTAYRRGLALHRLGRFDEALLAYAACAGLHPYFAEVHLEAARAHRARGDETSARASCEISLSRAARRPGFREEVEEFLGGCERNDPLTSS